MIKRRKFLKNCFTGTATFLTGSSLLKGAKKQPNIVWLMTEDNSIHYFKLYSKTGIETPHIRQLAEDGIIFNHAFSNCPVCSAARSVLATGSYGARIGTQYHRKFKPVPLPDGLQIIPQLFRDAGYYTSNKKKTDYNFIAGKKIWHSNKDWRQREKGQPFFHKQSFGVTHESKLHKANTGGIDEKVFVAPCHPDTPIFRQANKAYKEIHVAMDKEIGKIIDELKEEGLLEDTFIFYFGDHGGVLPGSKGYIYETGLHVPLVVRIPENFKHLVNHKRGSREDGFVSFIDFSPTILNLTGIKIPEQMDGLPFLGPGVTKEALKQKDETFGFADRFDEKYDLVRTIRKGKYKYMRSFQPFNFDGLMNNYRYKMLAYREWRELYLAGKLNKEQSLFFESREPEALYNLEKDPYEVKNIASDPASADILKDLRIRLSNKLKSLPDLSLYPESHLEKEAFDNPVGFGQEHKKEIAELIDIANLSLVPFSKAESGIKKALNSENPWTRYWGLIVCSCFMKKASGFMGKAKQIAQKDKEPLVRVRAAEFLGLISADDPRPVIMDVLNTTDHPLEALLTLNTVVLLQDGKPGYKFNITEEKIKAKGKLIDRRLEYLVR